MSKPPAELDGAKVICWAWSGEKPFGVLGYTTGGVASTIYGLAICQYSSGTLYRFSCNRDWEVEQDAPYESVEEAKRGLPDQYRNVLVNWKDYGET